MADLNTSRAAIARYWLGSEEGRRRYPTNPALMDLGEPHCFACGDAARWPAGELWSLWNGSGLERAHLVPRMLGGGDDVENLVLICNECHRAAPDVGDPTYMLGWMSRRESRWLRAHRAIAAALAAEGLRDQLNGFDRAQEDRLGETIDQLLAEWTGLHGSRVSEATITSVAIEAVCRTLAEAA